MRENEPDSCFIFLVGTKNDLLVSQFINIFLNHNLIHGITLTQLITNQPSEERQKTEKDAVKIATEMCAEFWAVSSKTGKKAILLYSEDSVAHNCNTNNN